MTETPQPIVKAYSISELAALYYVSTKTFKTWLKPYTKAIGPRPGRYYTTRQVRTIFESIGEPWAVYVRNVSPGQPPSPTPIGDIIMETHLQTNRHSRCRSGISSSWKPISKPTVIPAKAH